MDASVRRPVSRLLLMRCRSLLVIANFVTHNLQLWGSSSTFLNPTLGFVSNLSHTAIREAQEDDDRSVASHGSDSTTISISDEELALLGAPWAKEGMLCRKYFWEAAQKRAKDKSWLDVFVVIQKGQLSMFVFGENTGSGGGTVGGGNWLVCSCVSISLPC